MEQISRIGMDTSKHIFQLHGVNSAEEPVLRKKLRRKGDVRIPREAGADGDRDRSLRCKRPIRRGCCKRSFGIR